MSWGSFQMWQRSAIGAGAALCAVLAVAVPGPAAAAPPPAASPLMAPVVAVAAPASLRSWEWRRLDRTPLSQLTEQFAAFRSLGGTTVSLDVSAVVDLTEIADPRTRAAQQAGYRSKLAQYIARAAAVGLSVEAVAGSPHWIGPEVRYTTDIVAAFVTSFNASAPVNRRLVGLHFDLEPWGTDAWSTSKLALTTQLLDTVAMVAGRQARTPAGTRVPITIDLPFWLDGTTDPATTTYRGRTLSPTEHVMRLLDNGAGQRNSIVVMAYRDTTGGPDGSIAVAARELALAEQFRGRVRVTIGQEIGDVQPARTTFFQEGLPALTAAMTTLSAAYSGRQGFGGFAIDPLAALGDIPS